MNNKELAVKVLKLIGGAKNISNLTHCHTRLRFVLVDDSKARMEELEKLNGVMRVQKKGGQLQVVVGTKVDGVYQEVAKLAKLSNNTDNNEGVKKGNILSRFIDTVAGIFTPLLPALTGAGMLRAILALFTHFGLIDQTSDTAAIFIVMGDSVFYFLPFLLAISAARKFKTNEYLAALVAACMLHPTILDAAGTTIDFFGLPITAIRYTNSVIPIILAIYLLSYVYPAVRKVIPEFLKVILVPMMTLFIVVPLTLLIIGPFGTIVGEGLAIGINYLFGIAGVFTGAVLGFFRPILVLFGMHHSLMPIQIQDIAQTGGTLLMPSALAANLAQAGAAFGVFVLTKNKDMKSAAGSSGLTALFGITEPAIYGVTLKYKKPFFAACTSAALVSGFFALVNTQATVIATPGVLSVVTYEADNSIFIIIGCIIAVVLGFVFTLLAGIDETFLDKETDSKKVENSTVSKTKPLHREISIMSPLNGEVRNLSEVDDPTFSHETMGKGIAIIPTAGKVYAPFDGVVEVIFKAKHGVGLKSDMGAELLIHIGLETVSLEGKYFTAHVSQAQRIKTGDLLMEFDIEALKRDKFDIITPIIVTNSDDCLEVFTVAKGQIDHKTELMKIIK